MSNDLSPQSEQYLQQIVASGLYPSKEAAIDAAVEALREKIREYVSDEHAALVDEAMAESAAGKSRPMTSAGWSRLRELAHDVASRSQQGKT
jgi:Arc/MetJ-type ribon-helix-helix transcriptional regulator